MGRLGKCIGMLLAGAMLLPTLPARSQDGAAARFAEQFGEAFLDHYWALHGEAAVAAGYYRYATQLPAPDADYRRRLDAFLRENLAALDAIPAAELGPALRSDQAVLRNQLRLELWQLHELRDWQWQPSQYNIADAFALLLDTPYADEDIRLREVSLRLAQVPAYYAAAQQALQNPSRVHTELAIQQNQGSLDVFGDGLLARVAQSGLDAHEQQLFAQRLRAARGAIEAYVRFLRALQPKLKTGGAAHDFRIGAALYEQGFAYQVQTGMSPAALHARAEQEWQQVHARMQQLSAQLWPKYFPGEAMPQGLKAVARMIARLSEQHAAPAEFYPQIQALIPRLEAWVTQQDLLTLDPSRPLQIRVMPAYQRGYSMASLAAPGPYDPTARTWYNVAALDDYSPAQAESFLREYNRWLMQILSIHEAVPGHYVQLIYANKSPSLIKSLFSNNAMVEGWAVYAERMMLESGWGGGEPEMELMYDKWRLRVIGNTLLDYGVHVQNMSETQALRLLRDEAFQDETEARGKWRRAQILGVQLSFYYAGFSAIYDYREHLKQELGERFDLKRFHESFLSYGSAPVALITQLMQPQDAAR
ncbi:Uncharacterized conserved protein, DUF885 familyt [Solimonas aquatica]|uniref:Uncharacterized conserved protein, DUF885 familyt n=2 Tax=Solimonas aquatica TaxID=489703 RepID=A0A1H9IMJ7_9GAMM|nr:Uncharacterized conserved protein, DUF885 familyt [Solimonas aquatica]